MDILLDIASLAWRNDIIFMYNHSLSTWQLLFASGDKFSLLGYCNYKLKTLINWEKQYVEQDFIIDVEFSADKAVALLEGKSFC